MANAINSVASPLVTIQPTLSAPVIPTTATNGKASISSAAFAPSAELSSAQPVPTSSVSSYLSNLGSTFGSNGSSRAQNQVAQALARLRALLHQQQPQRPPVMYAHDPAPGVVTNPPSPPVQPATAPALPNAASNSTPAGTVGVNPETQWAAECPQLSWMNPSVPAFDVAPGTTNDGSACANVSLVSAMGINSTGPNLAAQLQGEMQVFENNIMCQSQSAAGLSQDQIASQLIAGVQTELNAQSGPGSNYVDGANETAIANADAANILAVQQFQQKLANNGNGSANAAPAQANPVAGPASAPTSTPQQSNPMDTWGIGQPV